MAGIDPKAALEAYLRGLEDATSLADLMAERSARQQAGTPVPPAQLVPPATVGWVPLEQANPDEFDRQVYLLTKIALDYLADAQERAQRTPDPEKTFAELEKEIQRVLQRRLDALKNTKVWVGPEQRPERKTRPPSWMVGSKTIGPTVTTLGGQQRITYRPVDLHRQATQQAARRLQRLGRQRAFTDAEVGSAIQEAIRELRNSIEHQRRLRQQQIIASTPDPREQQAKIIADRANTIWIEARLNDPAFFEYARRLTDRRLRGPRPEQVLRERAKEALIEALSADEKVVRGMFPPPPSRFREIVSGRERAAQPRVKKRDESTWDTSWINPNIKPEAPGRPRIGQNPPAWYHARRVSLPPLSGDPEETERRLRQIVDDQRVSAEQRSEARRMLEIVQRRKQRRDELRTMPFPPVKDTFDPLPIVGALERRLQRHGALLEDAMRLNTGTPITEMVRRSALPEVRQAAERLRLTPASYGWRGHYPTVAEITEAQGELRDVLMQRRQSALQVATEIQQRWNALERLLRSDIPVTGGRVARGSAFFGRSLRVMPGSPDDYTVRAYDAQRDQLAQMALNELGVPTATLDDVKTLLWYLTAMRGFERPMGGVDPKGSGKISRPTEEMALRNLSPYGQAHELQLEAAKIRQALVREQLGRSPIGNELEAVVSSPAFRTEFRKRLQPLLRRSSLRLVDIDPLTLDVRQGLPYDTLTLARGEDDPWRAVAEAFGIETGPSWSTEEMETGVIEDVTERDVTSDFALISSFPQGVTTPESRHEKEADARYRWTPRQIFFVKRIYEQRRAAVRALREQAARWAELDARQRARLFAQLRASWYQGYLGDVAWQDLGVRAKPLPTVTAYTLSGGREEERIFFAQPRATLLTPRVIARLLEREQKRLGREMDPKERRAFIMDLREFARQNADLLASFEAAEQAREGRMRGPHVIGGIGEALERWKAYGKGPEGRASIRTAPATSPVDFGSEGTSAYEIWRRMLSNVLDVADESVVSLLRSGEYIGQMRMPFNLIGMYLAGQEPDLAAALRPLIDQGMGMLGLPRATGGYMVHDGKRVRISAAEHLFEQAKGMISAANILAEWRTRTGGMPPRRKQEPSEVTRWLANELGVPGKGDPVIASFAQAFERELSELAELPDLVRLSGGNPINYLVDMSIASISAALGRPIELADIYEPPGSGDRDTRWRYEAPWPQHVPQEPILSLPQRIIRDVFYPGHEDPKIWPRRYRQVVAEQRERFRLGHSKAFDDLVSNRRRLYRLLDVWATMSWELPRLMGYGERATDLIVERSIAETPQEREQMLRLIFSMTAEQQRQMALTERFERAVPQLAAYLGGDLDVLIKEPLASGLSRRGPPHTALLEMSAILNALFEVVGGASTASQIFPRYGSENLGYGTFAQVHLSKRQWQQLNEQRRSQKLFPITLAHWMIAGEPGSGAGRGVGLRGLQTVEDWQAFERWYAEGLRYYRSSTEQVRFPIEWVREGAKILRWEQFAEGPEGVPELLERLSSQAKGGMVSLATPVSKFGKTIGSHRRNAPYTSETLITIAERVLGWSPTSVVGEIVRKGNVAERFGLDEQAVRLLVEDLRRQGKAASPPRERIKTRLMRAAEGVPRTVLYPARIAKMPIDGLSPDEWQRRFQQYAARGQAEEFVSDLELKGYTFDEIKQINAQIRLAHLEASQQLAKFILDKAQLAQDLSTVLLPPDAENRIKEMVPGFTRLLVGNRGLFVELNRPEDPGVQIGRYSAYHEWERQGKIFFEQIAQVSDTDFLPGKWYISFKELFGLEPKSYLRGTRYHPGGPALVGEAGPEVLRDPAGRLTLATTPTVIPDLPRGSQVISTGELRTALFSIERPAERGRALARGGLGRPIRPTVVVPPRREMLPPEIAYLGIRDFDNAAEIREQFKARSRALADDVKKQRGFWQAVTPGLMLKPLYEQMGDFGIRLPDLDIGDPDVVNRFAMSMDELRFFVGPKLFDAALQKYVRGFLNRWHGFAGSTEVAERHLLAAKVLGLDLAAYEHPVDVEARAAAQQRFERDPAYAQLEERLMGSVYKLTQEDLHAAGLKTLMLYRGMYGEHLAPYFPASGEVSGRGRVPLSLLSSFSPRRSWAVEFSQPIWDTTFPIGFFLRPRISLLLGGQVPAERVFSTAKTGFGAIHEMEFVVAGPHPDDQFQLTDVFRFNQWFVSPNLRKWASAVQGKVDLGPESLASRVHRHRFFRDEPVALRQRLAADLTSFTEGIAYLVSMAERIDPRLTHLLEDVPYYPREPGQIVEPRGDLQTTLGLLNAKRWTVAKEWELRRDLLPAVDRLILRVASELGSLPWESHFGDKRGRALARAVERLPQQWERLRSLLAGVPRASFQTASLRSGHTFAGGALGLLSPLGWRQQERWPFEERVIRSRRPSEWHRDARMVLNQIGLRDVPLVLSMGSHPDDRYLAASFEPRQRTINFYMRPIATLAFSEFFGGAQVRGDVDRGKALMRQVVRSVAAHEGLHGLFGLGRIGKDDVAALAKGFWQHYPDQVKDLYDRYRSLYRSVSNDAFAALLFEEMAAFMAQDFWQRVHEEKENPFSLYDPSVIDVADQILSGQRARTPKGRVMAQGGLVIDPRTLRLHITTLEEAWKVLNQLGFDEEGTGKRTGFEVQVTTLETPPQGGTLGSFARPQNDNEHGLIAIYPNSVAAALGASLQQVADPHVDPKILRTYLSRVRSVAAHEGVHALSQLGMIHPDYILRLAEMMVPIFGKSFTALLQQQYRKSYQSSGAPTYLHTALLAEEMAARVAELYWKAAKEEKRWPVSSSVTEMETGILEALTTGRLTSPRGSYDTVFDYAARHVQRNDLVRTRRGRVMAEGGLHPILRSVAYMDTRNVLSRMKLSTIPFEIMAAKEAGVRAEFTPARMTAGAKAGGYTKRAPSGPGMISVYPENVLAHVKRLFPQAQGEDLGNVFRIWLRSTVAHEGYHALSANGMIDPRTTEFLASAMQRLLPGDAEEIISAYTEQLYNVYDLPQRYRDVVIRDELAAGLVDTYWNLAREQGFWFPDAPSEVTDTLEKVISGDLTAEFGRYGFNEDLIAAALFDQHPLAKRFTGGRTLARGGYQPEHPRTVPYHDVMLQALYRAIVGEDVFDLSGQRYTKTPSYEVPHIQGLTHQQRRFMGLPYVRGGAPRVLTGPPGSGKTFVEAYYVLQQIQRRGPEAAPIWTSFSTTAIDVSKDALLAAAKGLQRDDLIKRYLTAGGLKTINALGLEVAETLGMGNVFGTPADVFQMATEPEQIAYFRQAIFNLAAKRELEPPAMQRLLSLVPVQPLRKFPKQVQELVSHYYSQEDLPNVWLPRPGSGEHLRPRAAIEVEQRSPALRGERMLQTWVRMLAETGLPAPSITDFFSPLERGSFAHLPDEIRRFANDPDMYLAARILEEMERLLRIPVLRQVEVDDPFLGKVKKEAAVRLYFPWEQYIRPLQYLMQRPEQIYNVGHLLNREYVLTEAQDANLAQLALIKLLAGDDASIIISGDPMQDIYRWRGGSSRWLHMAMEAASKSGSWVHLEETTRFTGDMARFLNEMNQKVVFAEGDQQFRLFSVPGLKPAASRAKVSGMPIALRYPAPDVANYKTFETQLVASLIQQMVRGGVTDPSMAAILEHYQIPRSIAEPGHFIVPVRTNIETAEISRAMFSAGIPTLPRFAQATIEEWVDLVKMFEEFGLKPDDITPIVRGTGGQIDAETFERIRAFGTRARGIHKAFWSGLHADPQGGVGAGLKNLLIDVLQAYEYLDVYATGKEMLRKEGERALALVGTVYALKGEGRQFAVVPSMIERLSPIASALTPVEAKTNFADVLTMVSRGSQAILLAPQVEEGQRGNWQPNIFFLAAEHFAQEGRLEPLQVVEGTLLTRPVGEAPYLAPPPSPREPSRVSSPLPPGQRVPWRSRGKIFARGSLDLATDLRPGERAIIGEAGKEYLIKANQGLFYEVDRPSEITIEPGDMVIPEHKLRFYSDALAAKIAGAAGRPVLADPRISKLYQTMMGGRALAGGAGALLLHSAMKIGDKILNRFLKQRKPQEDPLRLEPSFPFPVEIPNERLAQLEYLRASQGLGASRPGYMVDPNRAILAEFTAREQAEQFAKLMESAGLYVRRHELERGRTGVAAYGASKEQLALAGTLARLWETDVDARGRLSNREAMSQAPSAEFLKRLGVDPEQVDKLFGFGKQTILKQHELADLSQEERERLDTPQSRLYGFDRYLDRSVLKPLENFGRLIDAVTKSVSHYRDALDNIARIDLADHLKRWDEALQKGTEKLGSGRFFVSAREGLGGGPRFSQRDLMWEAFRDRNVSLIPHRRDQSFRVTEVYDPDLQMYRRAIPGDVPPAELSRVGGSGWSGGSGGGGGGRGGGQRFVGWSAQGLPMFAPSTRTDRIAAALQDWINGMWVYQYLGMAAQEATGSQSSALMARNISGRMRHQLAVTSGVVPSREMLGPAGQGLTEQQYGMVIREAWKPADTLLRETFNADRGYWSALGVDRATYENFAQVAVAAGAQPFTSEQLNLVKEMSQRLAEASKIEDKKEREATIKGIHQEFDVRITEMAPEVAKNLKDMVEIGAVAQLRGEDPQEAIRQTVQIASAMGYTPTTDEEKQASGRIYKEVYNQILAAADRSPMAPQDFLTAYKYVASMVQPLMSGEGFDRGKTKQAYLEQGLTEDEATALAKNKTLLDMMVYASTKGIQPEQFGRAMRSVTEMYYNPSESQSWLWARKQGIVDQQGRVVGTSTTPMQGTYMPTLADITEEGKIAGGVKGTLEGGTVVLPTYDPNVYQEALRRVQAPYQVAQAKGQLAQTRLELESLSVMTRSMTIDTGSGTTMRIEGGETRFDIEKASLALEQQASQLMFPLQQQVLAGQIGYQRQSLAVEERRLTFREEIQPLRREQFELSQAVEQRELARSQRSIAAQRAYETQLYGPSGVNRSYENYLAAQRGMMISGQGAQTANLATSVGAVVNAVGLEAAQTYAAIQHQRAMLVYGQSSVSSGAAFEEQMRYLKAQQEFAERGFEAADTYRGERRSIEDEALADRAAMLQKNQELERAMFEEQERQLKEERDLFEARKVVVEANLGLMQQELNLMPQRFEIQQKQYDLQQQQLDIEQRLNEERKKELSRTIEYLEKVIPLQAAYNEAVGAFLEGVTSLGTKENPLQAPAWEDFIKTVISGTQEDINALTRGDSTAAPVIAAIRDMFMLDDQGNIVLTPQAQEIIGKEPVPPDIMQQQTELQTGDETTAYPTKQETDRRIAEEQRGYDMGEITETVREAERRIEEGVKDVGVGKAPQIDLPDWLPDFFEERAEGGINWTLRGGADIAGGILSAGGGILDSVMGSVLVHTGFRYGPGMIKRLGRAIGKGGRFLIGGMARGGKALARGGGGGKAAIMAGRGGGWVGAATMALPLLMGLMGGDDEMGGDGGGWMGAVSSIGGMAATGAMYGGPWGALIGAGIGAGMWALQNPEEVKKAALEAWNGIKEGFHWIKETGQAVWEDVKGAAAGAWEAVKGGFDWIKEKGQAVWEDIKGAVDGAWEAVKGGFGWIKEKGQAAWEDVKGAADGAWEAVKGGFGWIKDKGEGAWEGIKGTADGAWGAVKGAFDTIGGISWGDIGDAALVAFEVLFPPFGLIKEVWDRKDEILGAVQEAWDALKGAFASAKDWTEEKYEGAKGKIEEAADAVKDKYNDTKDWFRNKIDGAKDTVTGAADGVRDGVVSVKNWFGEHIQLGGPDIKGAATGVIDWVKGIPVKMREGVDESTFSRLSKDLLNKIVIDPVNGLFDALSGFKISLKVKGVGFDITIPEIGKIPRLATGAYNFSGGLALVGEMGPELMYLPRGAAVFPAARTQAILSEITARNVTGHGPQHPVHVELHFHGVNQISEETLAKVKAEVVKAITDVLDTD